MLPIDASTMTTASLSAGSTGTTRARFIWDYVIVCLLKSWVARTLRPRCGERKGQIVRKRHQSLRSYAHWLEFRNMVRHLETNFPLGSTAAKFLDRLLAGQQRDACQFKPIFPHKFSYFHSTNKFHETLSDFFLLRRPQNNAYLIQSGI